MISKNIGGVKEAFCCGCGACRQICPVQCITMNENSRGFPMPVVDEKNCTQCGLCKAVCPEANEFPKNKAQKCFIAKAKDGDVLTGSTSGGIFSLLASEVLNTGGVVYGCTWDEDLTARHIRITAAEDIEKIRRSKYVQSDTGETFRSVKSELACGRKVLYSGTGCQLAGLSNYVGKGNREKLILVEVACHGVPSPGLFREYIRWIEGKTGKKVRGYSFRNRHKHKKGEHYQLKISFEDGTEEYRFSALDPYYSSFLSGRTLRDTCYKCRYKGDARNGDILLADFWGCEKEHPDFDGSEGASAVVCTTPAGIHLMEKIRERTDLKPSSWEKVTTHNKSLIYSAACENRKEGMDIEQMMPKTTWKTLVKIYTPEKLKYLFKRI